MPTVGLDFGTHQTKICIEDRSDVRNPKYRFWKFNTPEGESYALPSVIQIKKDSTLLFGTVNKKDVLLLPAYREDEPNRPNIEEPVMEFQEEEPKLVLPPKPKSQKKFSLQDLSSLLSNGPDPEVEAWKKVCKDLEEEYDQDHHIWRSRYERAKKKYDEEMARYDSIMGSYLVRHAEWEQKGSVLEPAVFRYFKQASYCNPNPWKHQIHQDILSIWYLAYIIFLLEKELRKDFTIQMGFPTGKKRMYNRQHHAVRLILSAYKLVEEVFDGNLNEFLSTPYTDLLSVTKKAQFESESDYEAQKEEYGIIALPEAYANLVTATTQHRIPKGISFVVDIGGGTTDVSLFNIENNDEPHIYGYISVNKGINSIVEEADDSTDVWKMNGFSSRLSANERRAVDSFKDAIRIECIRIIEEMFRAFQDVALPLNNLRKALENRILVYAGGGSTYDFLCTPIQSFTDLRHMNASLWTGFAIDDELVVKNMSPVLSTALGLSVLRDSDDIIVSNVNEIFSHLPRRTADDDLPTPETDYMLALGAI